MVVNITTGANSSRSRGGHLQMFLYSTHNEKMTVSIMSLWDFVFSTTYTQPDIKESDWMSQIRANVPR